MYNAAFKALGLPYTYVSFEVSDLPTAIYGLRALNIRGFSLSRPFKEQCIALLDQVDWTAARIGAVNVVQNQNGSLVGYNSDWIGAVKALEKHVQLEGKRVAVLGAGGAGRAIAYGLKARRADVLIFNRTRARAQRVAEELGVSLGGGLDELQRILSADIVVNATPVGSISMMEKDIVPTHLMRSSQTILDTVIVPLETDLIRSAKLAGCATVLGAEMFAYQGAAAFKHFTGYEAPIETMLQSLLSALSAKS